METQLTGNDLPDLDENKVNGEIQPEDEKYNIQNIMKRRQGKVNSIQNISLKEAWGGKSTTQDAGKTIGTSHHKPSNRKSWLQYMMAFAHDVSVVGLRYVASPSASAFRRSIWILLILFGAAFTTFQIENRIRRYVNYPVNVIIRVQHTEEMRFPTVTICNENRAFLSKTLSTG